MSTASVPLGLNSYFTKWTGGYKSWKAKPTADNATIYTGTTAPPGVAANQRNASAAPVGRTPGITYNRPSGDYLSDVPGGWYPKHRPLHHHRKSHSTFPASSSGYPFVPATSMKNSVPVGNMDIPGNTTFRVNADTNCSSCGVTTISAYNTKESKLSTTYYEESGQTKISTSQVRNALAKVRNGSSNGSKYCNENQKYYSDTKGYLQARCNSYKKKSMINSPLPDSSPDQHKVGPFPTVYKSGCNTEADGGCCVNTIYNPANKVFSTNTAVSSSTRLARLKYDTVTKAAQGLKDKWGPAVANNATYSGLPSAPYTTKSKHQKCVPHHRNGNKTLCFQEK